MYENIAFLTAKFSCEIASVYHRNKLKILLNDAMKTRHKLLKPTASIHPSAPRALTISTSDLHLARSKSNSLVATELDTLVFTPYYGHHTSYITLRLTDIFIFHLLS